MRWGNRADKTLAFALLLFVVTLFLKLNHPEAVWARFFSFCAEAALIGGVADWFAVTALFEKPLGFPYHTAILPRRREQFTLACVKMVQEEFFSKKSIFQRIKSMNFLHLMLNWLEAPVQKAALTGWILQYIEQMAESVNIGLLAGNWEKYIKDALREMPQTVAYDNVGRWLVQSGRDGAWLSMALQALMKKLEGEKGQQRIQTMLEGFRQDKVRGNSLASLLSVFAEMSNLVNFSESAAILQKRLLELLDEMLNEESEARHHLLAALHAAAANLVRAPEWQAFAGAWRDELLANVSFKEELQGALQDFCQQLLRPSPAEGNLPGCRSALTQIIEREIDSAIAVLKKDPEIQETIDRFLYDMVGRTALKAQLLLGDIAARALQGLTDRQINTLIYGKVEQDLLWIRMNGSIVGAIVGGCLFAVLELL